MPRREYHSSCVCVPPGGPPEGILDIAEYIVSRVIFVLFLFWGKNFLYGQAPFCTDVSVFAINLYLVFWKTILDTLL
jgi:hypothetical protein